MNSAPLRTAVDEIREEAGRLRRWGAREQGDALERAADFFEERLDEWEDAELTISEAAEESGYSAERLREMVREGKLPDNRPPGSQGPITLPRSSLPKKPTDTDTDRMLDEFVAELRR